jgi:hypothetical protein
MQSSKKELVTKLGAAQRQLDTALKLWFEEGDVVSIFSLAASAHQIIHDLNSKGKGDELLFDTLNIKDEFRREYIRHVKKTLELYQALRSGGFGGINRIGSGHGSIVHIVFSEGTFAAWAAYLWLSRHVSTLVWSSLPMLSQVARKVSSGFQTR